ncbi:amidohydrolase family protein, partial [bacterium]|nr:amidohydrolase family protein [bacterium]
MRANPFLQLAFLAAWALLAEAPPASAEGQADLILYGGKVIAVDQADRIYQAIAVQGEYILAVGSDAEILDLAGPHCRMIDLNGKTVTPGLVDSHYHLMYFGAQFWPGYLDIRYPVIASKADLLQIVGDYASRLNPGEWISGNQGFTLQPFETLDRWDLDGVAQNNPTYLRHSSGQFAVVNSAALDSAGIDKDTQNPPGSRIMHDEQGEPTGVLSHYPAENLVSAHAPGYGDRTKEQKFEDIERGQRYCLAAGYTSVQDVIVGSVEDILTYKEYADSGLLDVRVSTMLFVDTGAEADSLAKKFAPTDTVPDKFKFLGWKLAQDGGVMAGTVLLYDTTLYASGLSYPYHSQEELNHMIQVLYNTERQVAVHVLGDRGIDMTLTAFENAYQANPREDPRFRIEHGLFPTGEAGTRMRDSGIILSTQPQWLCWYSDGYATATNEATMNRLLPLKTMLDNGIHLAFGCDVPASMYQEPQWAFHGATMRRSMQSGTVHNILQRLDAHETLRIHTLGSAYAGFADSLTGSLEPGKYADIVIWSHDLYDMQPSELAALTAEMTIVGGVIVHDLGLNPVTVSVQSGDAVDFVIENRLSKNHPNPFNPSTQFSFSLASPGHVCIFVYNMKGERIRILADGEKPAGGYRISWDGRSDDGIPV